MRKPLISVENFSLDFVTDEKITHALQHISFQIERGKTLALVGESGSGKSVSALSILRLLPLPQAKMVSGKIIFNEDEKEGIDLAQLGEKEMNLIRGKKIGMIFQEPMTSLNPLMTCGQQVAETLVMHKKISTSQAYHETIKWFAEVKLPEPELIFSKYPHELSGGQKQRVMISMAICCEPLLLIADEPTTALDVTVQKTILDLLKELQRKMGMAILFITHDLSLVKYLADEVLIMYQSRCIESGSVDKIFSNPTETYTKGLLSCRPPTTHRVKFLQTVQEFMNETIEINPQTNRVTASTFENKLNDLSKQAIIFECKNLEIHYPLRTNFWGKVTAWHNAVQGVNLQIHTGETMGLVGESGCGKTSVGKAMVLLNKISGGEILYKGKNISDFSRSELADYKRQVQIIFQDPYSSLNPRISIGQAIKEPMEVHQIHNEKNRKEKVIDLLNKVGLLPEHYHRYPHEFSGGQRQRICIARTLALEPEFIICDESVSALDVSIQAQVLNLLSVLRDEFNLSYLFISHDLGVIKHISNRVAVMHQGKICELNDAETIYHSPKADYTKFLLESTFS
ncbi:MAG: ABC transporter ATP-binding protein [Bacteroidetes bacterium]|nr:ABC transporter ATP-binding protein [Bacteroidota bacterium]